MWSTLGLIIAAVVVVGVPGVVLTALALVGAARPHGDGDGL